LRIDVIDIDYVLFLLPRNRKARDVLKRVREAPKWSIEPLPLALSSR
jgi:hypothetical protein